MNISHKGFIYNTSNILIVSPYSKSFANAVELAGYDIEDAKQKIEYVIIFHGLDFEDGQPLFGIKENDGEFLMTVLNDSIACNDFNTFIIETIEMCMTNGTLVGYGG